MTYIEYSIGEIKKKMKADEKDGIKTILRIETTSGSVEPRKISVIEIGEDYIIGRGRDKQENEVFSFNHIASWRFAKYEPAEWKGWI
jgi:hypothetical protein